MGEAKPMWCSSGAFKHGHPAYVFIYSLTVQTFKLFFLPDSLWNLLSSSHSENALYIATHDACDASMICVVSSLAIL